MTDEELRQAQAALIAAQIRKMEFDMEHARDQAGWDVQSDPLMSDDTQRVLTADLKLVLRNTESAARDAAAAVEATERLINGIGPRFDSLESRFATLEVRFATLEVRMSGLERRVGSAEKTADEMARSIHRIERTLADSNHDIQQMLSDILAKLP